MTTPAAEAGKRPQARDRRAADWNNAARFLRLL